MKLSSCALPSSLSPVMRMTYLLVRGGEVGVGVDQRLAHPLGVVDVLAEDDGLREAVGALEELGDLGGDELRCACRGRGAVEVAVVVDRGPRSPGRTCRAGPSPAASRPGLCRGRYGRPCRARGSRRAMPCLQRIGVDRARRSSRCWRRLWFPSAWRSGRSAWRTRNIRGSRARPHPRRRCRGGTRRRR